jgi:pyrroloquinoline quinone (PQQ) biosynthesis protein C
MALTFELATFSVREADEASLVAERPQMIAALGRAFPGLLAAWLAKRDDGSWIDVILWRSREEAERAAKHVDGVPSAKAWFRHIAESHGLQHVEVAHEELLELVRR